MLSIQDIIKNNQLISGRLRLTSTEMKRIYRLQLQKNQAIQKKLNHNEAVVKASLNRIKNLKSKLKYCEETLQKAFHPSTENIALLYKNVGNHYYIKARFYWQGKQREVQVGSIPIVLDIINNMLSKGYLHDISFQKSSKMTWKKFKNNINLIKATKKIAALKFQEYIIRKLYFEDTEQFRKSDLKEKNSDKPVKPHSVTNYADDCEEEKLEWYVQWRNNNLK